MSRDSSIMGTSMLRPCLPGRKMNSRCKGEVSNVTHL